MSVSERATARRAATTWAQHARRLAEILCSRTRTPKAALSARFSLTLAVPTLSRRRCSFYRLGILLTLLGGASATTATFNFTSCAPSGVLLDREFGSAGDPPSDTCPGWSTGHGGFKVQSPFNFWYIAAGAAMSRRSFGIATGPSAGVGGNFTLLICSGLFSAMGRLLRAQL